MSSSAVFQALSSAATDLVSDPSKREALRQEALNALRSTPKGLETPAYTVERTLDGGVELRNYEAYAIARLSSSKATASGNDFGALASYLFGANAESRAMEMTMPVETGSQGEGMAFVLPKAYAEAPPAPDSVDVEIAAVPARRVLALAFGGIATRNEIDRQRDAPGAPLATYSLGKRHSIARTHLRRQARPGPRYFAGPRRAVCRRRNRTSVQRAVHPSLASQKRSRPPRRPRRRRPTRRKRLGRRTSGTLDARAGTGPHRGPRRAKPTSRPLRLRILSRLPLVTASPILTPSCNASCNTTRTVISP